MGSPMLRGMTTYEAFITADWESAGIAQVAILRNRGAAIEFAGFIVDIWCLGVKDAMAATDLPAAEVRELLDGWLPIKRREPIDPHCARKLIEGAVAFAEGLGFAPHKDYRKARHVLSGLDAKRCPTEFGYGRNGRPFYVQGIESDDAADRVIARLNAVLGEDGFDYERAPESEFADDDDFGEEAEGASGDDVFDVREALTEFLDQEPPSMPRFFALSGMMTAAILAPQSPQPLAIIDLLWGRGGKKWESEETMEEFTDNVMMYWSYLVGLVSKACAADAPADTSIVDVWDDDCPEDFDTDQFVVAAMIEWAGGFLRVLQAWPARWENLQQAPELAESFALIRAYAEFRAPGNKEKIAAPTSAGSSLDQAVATIGRAARPELR